jgi:hypothetical protein
MLNLSPASFEKAVRRRSTRMLLWAIACATSIFATQGVARVQEPFAVHDFADVGVSLMPSTAPQ